jgi:hypothetical protein
MLGQTKFHRNPVDLYTRECQGTVPLLSLCERQSCFSSGSNNLLILVDTFEESVRFQIATFIRCKVLPDGDPKELVYYTANVAELGLIV